MALQASRHKDIGDTDDQSSGVEGIIAGIRDTICTVGIIGTDGMTDLVFFIPTDNQLAIAAKVKHIGENRQALSVWPTVCKKKGVRELT